jgi:RimJ/RimL family protein N-acetyltransferase
MHLATTRLTLQPLTAAELAFYIQDNQQLEQELGLATGSRELTERVKNKIAESIIPAVTRAGELYEFHTIWIVIDTASKTIVADLYCKGEPNASGDVEIGYGTYPAYQGRGLMTEAVAGLVRWAFTQKNIRAVLAETDPGNTASQKVLQRNHFRISNQTPDNICWRLERKDLVRIRKATKEDAPLLAAIAAASFIESHGHSAPAADIQAYVAEKYNPAVLQQELQDPDNIYHLLYFQEQPAGYSRIIFNTPCPGSPEQHITKLERLYLLKAFYKLQLGTALFEFNVNLMKENKQAGAWLYVWKDNQRAVQFYQQAGFVIIGSHDFQISATHSNPNHRMLLRFR